MQGTFRLPGAINQAPPKPEAESNSHCVIWASKNLV